MSKIDPKVIQELSEKYGVSIEVSKLALSVSYGIREDAEEYLKYVKESLTGCESGPIVDAEPQVFVLHFNMPVEDKNYPDCYEPRISVIIATSAIEAYEYLTKSYLTYKVPPIEQVRIETYPFSDPGVIYDSNLDGDM